MLINVNDLTQLYPLAHTHLTILNYFSYFSIFYIFFYELILLQFISIFHEAVVLSLLIPVRTYNNC